MVYKKLEANLGLLVWKVGIIIIVLFKNICFERDKSIKYFIFILNCVFMN